MRRIKQYSHAFMILVAIALPLSKWTNAQTVAVAEASGEVLDPTGSAVAGATVKMIETARGVSHNTASDQSGRYTLPNLPVGEYRLEVSASGFKA
jgi:Carboxypeptidase regulatory-like domain